MGAPRTLRTVLPILMLILVSAFLGWPRIGGAAHDLGQDCYDCHNIRSGQVWQGSYSVWSGKPIGMTSYGRPITCEVCHTNYGPARFTSSSASHHPVQVIGGTSMATDNWTTTLLFCKDCHNADSVSITPNLTPDLAPSNYLSISGNTGTDGYPNHDVTSPDNQVNAGDPPHLLAMRLSAGQRTSAGSGTYNKVPSSTPAADYAFCFSCHDGSNNTSRGATDNILDAYVKKGHYFKSAAPTGGAINDRIPCSDCHASHNSPTNARLFEPDNTTWTGTRPTGLTMANEANPTASEIRAICIFCHEDYNASNLTQTLKRVRNVQPLRRTYGVTGHAGTDLQSCNQCHNTHNPPAGGDDCLNCHRTGGGVQAKHQMTDLEFPADGTPGEDNAAVQVSGHKGVAYTSPYNTKAQNECKKCHGTAHPSDAAKVQMADGSSTWATGFVYGLSWSGSAWSANASSFADGNGNGIIDGNEFCMSCHDGVDALSPTDNANIRIGGVNPPKVWFPDNTTNSTGHDRKAGSNYPASGNAPARQLCLSCHKYHTSDRLQLFPGNFGPFGAGNGYTYSMPTWGGIATNWQAPRPATSSFPSNAGRMVLGTVNANALNFTDRSNPSSGKGFGTAGAVAGTDGFCNACHRDAATVTSGTLNTAHTHEGNGVSPSQNTFVKDCVECHNPHGGGGGATPNISMIRQTVGRDNTSQNAVVFTARTGSNSFDENDGGTESNADDLCATCHDTPAIGHNYRTYAGAANHQQGTACTSCHPHGQTDNAAKFGFPQAACNSCHGATSDAAGMPAVGDNGVYHGDANPVIGTRGGDNTSHKIHVNYLVNRRGVAASSTCYVCHRGGGGQETHPGNPANVNFKSGTQPSASYVQVVIDNAWRLDNTLGSATYSGTPGSLADGTNGWKTCSNTSCHYALSPSWAGKQQQTQASGTLTVSSNDWPPNGTVGAGSTAVVDNIALAADASGFVRLSQFKVRLAPASTADNSDISAVAFWEDLTGDGVQDNPIGGAAVFSAVDNSYTLSALYGMNPGTNRSVLLVVQFSPQARDGRTAAFRMDNGYLVASYGKVNSFATHASSTFTISKPGSLTAGSPDAFPPEGSISPGTARNVIDKIVLSADAAGAVDVSMLKVRLSASATAQDNTDVAALRFYEDADLDNVIDNPGAPLGGGSAVYSAADRSYTRSGMALHLNPGQSKNVLVAVDIRPVPTIGRTIVTEGASVSYVGTNAAVTTYTPFTSSAFTVSPDATPPAAVEDFNARDGENGQSTLTWTNPPDGDLQEVKVLRRTDVYPSGANDNIALTVYDNTAPVPSAPVTYPSAGLANGTTYYYAVFAKDVWGNWNNTVRQTPPLPGNANRGIPGPQTLGSAADTYIDNTTPTANYGTGGTMSVRNTTPRRILVRFDLSQFPAGTTVTDARIRLYAAGGAPSPARTYNAHRVTASWVESGTGSAHWNNMNANYDAAVAGSRTTTSAWNEWVITGLVSSWISGAQPNYGVMIKDSNESGTAATGSFSTREYTTTGYRPQLVVTFSGAVYAPPREIGWDNAGGTGGGFACNSCHQFGPRDHPLSGGTSGNPLTGLHGDQYYYAWTGSHIRHGVGDTGSPVNPAAADAGRCVPCHGSVVLSYNPVDHIDGGPALDDGRIGYGNPAGGGSYLPGGNGHNGTCSNVNCHAGAETPPWGAGSTSCTSCHGQGPGRPWPAAGSHDAHFAALGYTALADNAAPGVCDSCHAGYGAGTPYHADGNRYQVAFPPLFQGKKAATPTYSGGGDGTCANIRCHGGQATPNWSSGAIDPATQCAVCHIRENVPDRATATEYNSAISGLHAVTTTVSGKDHWADPAATCGGAGACHAGPPANHFGANLLDSAMAELTMANAGLRAGIAVAAGPGHDPNRDTCAVDCHLDGGRWARQNDRGRAALPIDDAGVCATCHGMPATGWTAGAGVLVRPDLTGVGGQGAMTAGHDNDWNADGVSGEVTSGKNHNLCMFCHGMNSRNDRHANYFAASMWDLPGQPSDHGNGMITLNGPSAAINAGNNATPAGMEYNGNDDNTIEASDHSCANACHYGAGNANHNMGRSGWPVQYRNFGGGSCSDCHGPGGSGPQVVWPAGNRAAIPNVTQGNFGSHLVATKTDPAFTGSTDWRAQCNKCHTAHGGSGVNVQIPMPPASWNNNNGLFSVNMQRRLGFDNGTGSWSYAKEAGIWIGGTATTGGTEAEVCWNCHGLPANQVSEWGYNTKTTPAGYPVAQFPAQGDGTAETFHFGWIYTSTSYTAKTPDWTSGYWMDSYDNAIGRRVASIHSASFDPAGQVSSVQSNVDANGAVNRTSPVLEARQYIRCSYCHDVHDLGAAQGPPADTPNKGKPFLRGKWVGNPYPPELPPRSGYAYTTRVNIAGPATPRALSTSRDKGGYFIDQNSNWPTDNPAMDSAESTAGLCQLCHGTNVDTMDFYTGGTKLWLGSMTNGHSNSTLGGTRSNARDIFTGSRYGAGMGMQWNVPVVPSYSCEFGCDGNYPQSTWMNGSENQQYLRNSGWFGGPVDTLTQGGGDFANWYGTGTIGGAKGAGSMAHKFTCSKCHSPHATGLPALLTHNCVDPALGNFTVYGSSGANLIANNCHRKTTTTDGWHRLQVGQ